MAKTFSDFSQLKALKKDLPQEAPKAAPTLAEPKKRQRTTILKTKEEIHAQQEGFKKEQRIRMIDSNDEGRIIGFTKKGFKLELEDGLVIEAMQNEFYVVSAEDDSKLRRSVSPSIKKSKQNETKKSIPQDEVLEVDMHLERIPGCEGLPAWAALDFQMEYFRRIMRQNLRYHGKKIVFIHGVGDGKLRDAIRTELEEVFVMACTYTVGQWQQYGMGATTVTIK